jgi:hypothetical protein
MEAVNASKRRKSPITVVSGLPRSGTSMLMRMLHLGGYSLCVDGIRAADIDNPYGYFEYEPVRSIRYDNRFLSAAEARAIKVISHLLQFLSPHYDYKVIFLERDLVEIIASQRKMLAHRIGQQTILFPEKEFTKEIELYQHHLESVRQWLSRQPNIRTLYLSYAYVVDQPAEAALDLSLFLGGRLSNSQMAKAVDPELYRNKDMIDL